MANDFNISYSYTIGGADPAPSSPTIPSAAQLPADDQLYAFDPCDSLPLAEGVLLVSKNTGVRLAVTAEVSVVLQHCTSFRTLSEHAQHLLSVMPELNGDTSDTARVLSLVRDAGLMIAAGDLCERVNGAVGAADALAPTTVFVITCDRPDAVNRLLESMLENAALSQHRQLFLVDDSRDASNALRNRDAVEQFNLTSPVNMHYFGDQQQRALQDMLIDALPDSEQAVRFIIDREGWQGCKTYGRSRTLCLLLSVDTRCIVVDDDILCQAVYPQGHHAAASVGDATREASFFANSSQSLQQTSAAPQDPLAGHARCLGMGLASALDELQGTELGQGQLRNAQGDHFRYLDAHAPVLVTQCGTFGDPGTGGNAWLVNLSASSRERMLGSEGGLAAALVNRHCWLGQFGPNFTKRAVMSQITGLDNTRLLPPYFPAFRGEDQLFGAVVNFLYPESLALEYSWGVPHLPLESRSGSPAGDSTVPMGSMQLFAGYLAERAAVAPNLPLDLRVQGLCQVLEELAASDSNAISAVFARLLTRSQALAIQNLSDQMADNTHGSAEWNAYLQRCMKENGAALQPPARLVGIPGVPADMDEETVAATIREYVGLYASTLRNWSTIRSLAKSWTTQQYG